MNRSLKKNTLTAGKVGFTLIEIMIVVLIVAILLSVAVPNFIRAREQSRAKACSTSLKQIDSAKEQYALNNKLNTNDAVAGFSLLVGPSLYLKATPACPSGGVYTIGNISTNPSCNRNNPPTYVHTFNGLP